MVWPLGCVCHAVRAPGVKWTLLADRRAVADGVATASIKTAPVNHSLGPGVVSMESLVICMSFSLAVDGPLARSQATQLLDREHVYRGVSLSVAARACGVRVVLTMLAA